MGVRLLVVGEDFGRSEVDERYALTGSSGRRIADLLGVSIVEWALRADRTNVVPRPADWSDADLLRRRAAELQDRMAGRRTVLLGRRVAGALGRGSQPYHEWRDGVAVAPHPSGRNRWYNDPANVEEARTFWREATRW